MSWIIAFNIVGENFNPHKIGVDFNQKNTRGDTKQKGALKGTAYGYGSATYVAARNVQRLSIFKHIADLFEPLIDDLKKHGAENWWIEIGRMYSTQCNEELDFEELEHIVRLKCSVSYTAYCVTEEEEKAGFDVENYGK